MKWSVHCATPVILTLTTTTPDIIRKKFVQPSLSHNYQLRLPETCVLTLQPDGKICFTILSLWTLSFGIHEGMRYDMYLLLSVDGGWRLVVPMICRHPQLACSHSAITSTNRSPSTCRLSFLYLRRTICLGRKHASCSTWYAVHTCWNKRFVRCELESGGILCTDSILVRSGGTQQHSTCVYIYHRLNPSRHSSISDLEQMAEAVDIATIPTSTSAAASAAPTASAEVERLNIPFVIDRIDVTDPEQIRKITTHPDIDRIHGVPTKDKPWWVSVNGTMLEGKEGKRDNERLSMYCQELRELYSVAWSWGWRPARMLFAPWPHHRRPVALANDANGCDLNSANALYALGISVMRSGSGISGAGSARIGAQKSFNPRRRIHQPSFDKVMKLPHWLN